MPAGSCAIHRDSRSRPWSRSGWASAPPPPFSAFAMPCCGSPYRCLTWRHSRSWWSGAPDGPDDWSSLTPADLADISRENTSFALLGSWSGGAANLVGAGGEPERVSQTLTSANFFDVVGVQPALGRAFQPGEDQPGREREVILSDRLWQRRFGGDPRIVGQNIRFDDENYHGHRRDAVRLMTSRWRRKSGPLTP